MLRIPSAVCQFPCLTRLDLNNNAIQALPDDFGHWIPNVIFLALYSNYIEKLPKSLDSCISLYTLDIRNNLLTWLPPTLNKLVNLHGMWLEDNPRLLAYAEDVGWCYSHAGHGHQDTQAFLRMIAHQFTYHEARASTICLLALAHRRKAHVLSRINNVLEYVLAPMLYETREDDDAWRRP